MPNVDSQSPDCSPLPKRQCSASGGLPARRIQRRTSNDEGPVREGLPKLCFGSGFRSRTGGILTHALRAPPVEQVPNLRSMKTQGAAKACSLPNLEHGGEGGIRTLDTLLGYGALAKRCFQPLSHLTKKFSRDNMAKNWRLPIGDCPLKWLMVISEEEARAKILETIRPLPARR